MAVGAPFPEIRRSLLYHTYGIRISYYAHLTGILPMRLYWRLIDKIGTNGNLKICLLGLKLVFEWFPVFITNKPKRPLTSAARLESSYAIITHT